ncbi:ankyrin repeat and zinc finger domain-containing protein 1-like isoform X2 [Hydractinia symbiolongicarpus]|uniref:ankyrin repeat and zinc finger domain-containing protein 1-like isoform X2 n=1 Tax=Hydractinia symbiolongicarpus TaxID=13093 RepID=UPI00254C72E4|nr:ankyrin repeat and zinc finger domain-containing protein 1-like isoform X2 [Hydractinia symbiolongicarpus]
MKSMKIIQKLLPLPSCSSVFDQSAKKLTNGMKLYEGLKQGKLMLPENEFMVNSENLEVLPIQDDVMHAGMQCSICKVKFDNNLLQREHYKLDWHRFNAKQKLLAKRPISEEEFNYQISGELSSISGSDSESDDDMEPVSLKREDSIDISEDVTNCTASSLFFGKHPLKFFFQSEEGKLIALYRNVVSNAQKINDADSSNEILGLASDIWIYLMFSTGHFAGAVYERNKIIAHKTFHRYTVRAKRGTAQSLQDKKQGHTSKSAGASIRRYNEAALTQEVQSLLSSWSRHFQQADKIFYKCSTYNSHILFFNKDIITKDDGRCCKISLNTRRPTLNETKRIHSLFTTIENYGPVESIEKLLDKYITEEEEKTTRIKNNLNNVNINSDFEHRVKTENEETTEEKKKNKKKVLKSKKDTSHVDSKTKETIGVETYVETDDKTGDTLLHRAAKSRSKEIISLLLQNGCDPCERNKEGKVPYDVAADKSTRNEFRRFMAKYPEKYDYKKAKIPSPLSEEQEDEQRRKNAEKKKSQNKARKDKLKAKKAEEMQQILVEKEQKAFEGLSDREKRAVMAERRFASQLTNSLRCSNCRKEISEKEAFERYEYKYCSTDCVHSHKMLIGK